jgi:hypothetical protein
VNGTEKWMLEVFLSVSAMFLFVRTGEKKNYKYIYILMRGKCALI